MVGVAVGVVVVAAVVDGVAVAAVDPCLADLGKIRGRGRLLMPR